MNLVTIGRLAEREATRREICAIMKSLRHLKSKLTLTNIDVLQMLRVAMPQRSFTVTNETNVFDLRFTDGHFPVNFQRLTVGRWKAKAA